MSARMSLVAKEPAVALPEAIAAGWARLANGEWKAAGKLFNEALSHEETPEALEGLSWASWWLDDATAVFDTRERAYLLFRRRGEDANAARMAIWLAADQVDFRGAMAVASGWLGRARRLLDPLEPTPEHGWLAFQEGYFAYLAGDTHKAADLSTHSAEAGRRFNVPDLEMLGLALHGATLVARAEVEKGMSFLDEATATALAGEATIPISGAWTCCFLVGSCAAIRDFERASQWCDRIAEFAERFGSRYMLAFCRAEYGAVRVWQGRWSDAEQMLELSIEDFARSRPAWVDGPLVGLAELRRRQGRPEEALALLDRAGPSASAQLCRARLALDQGQSRLAVELIQRLLRRAPADLKLDRAVAFEHLVRARVARGELEEAANALDSLREIEELVKSEPLTAATDLAEGLLEAARGGHERARVLMEDVVDRYERIGAPFEAAQARIELAMTLRAAGREELGQSEAAAAHELLRRLGAEPEARRAVRVVGDPADGLAGITRREREVLELIAAGLTNRQIAVRLVISEHTVHRHITNLLRKLDLPSRTAAAVYAMRSGLLNHTGT